MATIALLNQKGGVGKTTTTANVGAALAKKGLRVLMVDNDPQASLTQGLLGPEAVAALPAEATIAAAYTGAVVRPEQLVRATEFERLELIPGSELAAGYNDGRPHERPWELQTCLAELLGELSLVYDRILIDCPPNLNLCSWAALAASDWVLVPVQPEDYGAQGLPAVRRSIEAVRQVVNPRLQILGLVVTMYVARRSIHQVYSDLLRQRYGAEVFTASIPDAADIPEATMLRKPVVHHKPRGAAAKAIVAVADELEARLVNPTSQVCEEAA